MFWLLHLFSRGHVTLPKGSGSKGLKKEQWGAARTHCLDGNGHPLWPSLGWQLQDCKGEAINRKKKVASCIGTGGQERAARGRDSVRQGKGHGPSGKHFLNLHPRCPAHHCGDVKGFREDDL